MPKSASFQSRVELQITTLPINHLLQVFVAKGHDDEISLAVGILSGIEDRNDMLQLAPTEVLGNVEFAMSCLRGGKLKSFDGNVSVRTTAAEDLSEPANLS